MKTVLMSACALVFALAFGSANLAFSADTPAQPQGQAQTQMTPDPSSKAEHEGKRVEAKSKKAQKKKAKKARKSAQSSR